MMPTEVATLLLLYLKILLHQWLFDDWQAITVAAPNRNYHLKIFTLPLLWLCCLGQPLHLPHPTHAPALHNQTSK